MVGGHQPLWRDAQGVGGGNKVGFVGHQEIQCCHQHSLLANARAQFLGRNAGKREEALGMGVVRQHPAQRGQSQRFGVVRNGGRVAKDCLPRGLSVRGRA